MAQRQVGGGDACIGTSVVSPKETFRWSTPFFDLHFVEIKTKKTKKKKSRSSSRGGDGHRHRGAGMDKFDHAMTSSIVCAYALVCGFFWMINEWDFS